MFSVYKIIQHAAKPAQIQVFIKRCKHKTLNNLKGKGVSSQQWLTRQFNDPYVEKAKMMNYRCRSAFKLMEIDDRFRIFKGGQTVIDCGAAPGSWTQVAVERTSSESTKMVIAIDRLQFYPITGATILGNSDFTTKEVQSQILNLLDGRRVDVVLSDMAPNASGIKAADQENIINLCYSVLKFALNVSVTGASLIVKLWQGTGAKQLQIDIERFYKVVKVVKPLSSRADSAEIFLVAREFRGLKT